MLDVAARATVVIAPSPLEGEGKRVCQPLESGEGSRAQRAHGKHPSPTPVSLRDRAALSLMGRGRNNARPSRCTNMGGA
jgi:hypothetical protein